MPDPNCRLLDRPLKPVAGLESDALLNMTKASYIELVQWTGKQARPGGLGASRETALSPLPAPVQLGRARFSAWCGLVIPNERALLTLGSPQRLIGAAQTCTIVLMKVIVDSSAVMAVALAEPERQGLIRVTRGTEACAPEILPYEIGNALSAMIKRDRLSLDQAIAAHEAFSRMTIRLLPSDIRSALKLSKKLGIYAYDAYFLVCAQRLDCPLITLDRRMRQVARELGIVLLEP